MSDIEQRKNDHINLALRSQVKSRLGHDGFFYEPLLGCHPQVDEKLPSRVFLGKNIRLPLWVSSMTGGASHARKINHTLASLARDFQMGMALGSCRPLLESRKDWQDYNIRPILGDQVPFFANIGYAQLENLDRNNELERLDGLVSDLKADGLVIHINPLQEWYQPSGDRFVRAPVEWLKTFITQASYRVIVKEVGQGMGPESLKYLVNSGVDGIEFSAFGGTNFSLLEQLRDQEAQQSCSRALEDLAYVGHYAREMVDYVNDILAQSPPQPHQCPAFIISGGVQSPLEGYYLMKKLAAPAIFGQASKLLDLVMQGEERAREYLQQTERLLLMAQSYLRIKN